MIYIVFAPPREGKTYFCTMKALEVLKKNKRKCFSNYPIIYTVPLGFVKTVKNLLFTLNNFFGFEYKPLYENEIRSSLVWSDDFIYQGVSDSDIFIDEAYRSFSSRTWKDFNVDIHTFFATNGHDNNNIYLIAQHINRLDGIIREMVNVFYYVTKISYPFSDNPFLFIVRGYLTEDDFIARKKRDGAVYARYTLVPNSKIKNAYDTHYFRHENPKTDFISWLDTIQTIQ